jgi:MoaA/NifB/PqqE/SkfB family radical SAM enzyme
LRGQQGLFAVVKRGVMALHGEKRRAGRGPMLRANVVLMRDTVGEFPGLCRELAGWGIEEIVCNQLGGIDRPEFYPAHRLEPEQVDWLAEIWSALRAELADAGVRLQGSQGYLRRMAATARGRRQAMDECHPGERFLFITETGIASPCSFTTREYGVPLEEISTIDDLLALPERFQTKRRDSAATACADCQSTQVCGKFASAA